MAYGACRDGGDAVSELVADERDEWQSPPGAPSPAMVGERWPPALARDGFFAKPAVLAVGVLLVLLVSFCAYEFWFTSLLESRSQSALLADFKRTLPLASTPTLETPPEGRPLGLVQIPSIGVQQVLVQGVRSDDTKKGPGHDPSTPAPGQAGNAVVIGRRTSYGAPFKRLDELEAGAKVLAVTRNGEFTYTVTSKQVRSLGSREVVAPTTDDRLTLITSNPPYFARSELVVFAKLEGQGLQAPAAFPLPPTGFAPGKTPGVSAWGGVLLWGELLLGALVGTWYLYRRRWSHSVTYLLTTPLLIALVFLFFGAVDRLLAPSL